MTASTLTAGPAPTSTPQYLVDARGLTMHFRSGGRTVRAVDGIDLQLEQGKTLSLVGESGCGKSTAVRALLQLYKPTSGSVLFDGVELTGLRPAAVRRIRRHAQMIFQDPFASLNPRMTVGEIIGEPLAVHGIARGSQQAARVRELLASVGLSPNFAGRYPHEFSGGQRQRIGIARALAPEPKFIAADEPFSALDVSVQAQIVNLLEDLQERLGLTYLLVAHDLAVVQHIADKVSVMYLGKIAEFADRDELYGNPRHPYTQALLSAVPIPDPVAEAARERIVLRGDAPSPADPPSGCRFRTRCQLRERLGNPDACEATEPELLELSTGHFTACHFASDA
jgi:oligopeptide transport system ATP-binding protein